MSLIPGTNLLIPSAYYEATKDQVRYKRNISGPFEDAISSGQRKRIAKCEKAGMFAGAAPSRMIECYSIVLDNRVRKGREYSMKFADWEALDKAFPESVVCFIAGPGPVAAALCVRLTPEILYVQAWGEIAGMEEFSPVTLLCKAIYNWCARHGVKTLDIGTADDQGLIDFKERLGFHAAS